MPSARPVQPRTRRSDAGTTAKTATLNNKFYCSKQTCNLFKIGPNWTVEITWTFRPNCSGFGGDHDIQESDVNYLYFGVDVWYWYKIDIQIRDRRNTISFYHILSCRIQLEPIMALKWCFSDTKIVYILEVSDRFTQPKQYSRQITDNLGEGECQLVVRRMLPRQLSGPGNKMLIGF